MPGVREKMLHKDLKEVRAQAMQKAGGKRTAAGTAHAKALKWVTVQGGWAEG